VQQRVVESRGHDDDSAGREIMQVAANTVPGLSSSDAGRWRIQNPTRGASTLALAVHGSTTDDQKLMQKRHRTDVGAGSRRDFGAEHNAVGLQEMTVDTSAATAESASGGVRVNLIPREGGKHVQRHILHELHERRIAGRHARHRRNSASVAWARQTRSNTPSEINPGFGGPIKRDKLWYFLSMRYMEDEGYIAGMYYNKNARKTWTCGCTTPT
jgi:hypothetical protein